MPAACSAPPGPTGARPISSTSCWLSDTLRTLLAGRIETVRLDGTAGIFPSTLLPPPDNPDLLLQSLGFMPKSISFSVVKDLPSWMVASATVQRIERAPHRARAVRPWRARRTRHVRDRQSRPEDRDRQHRRDRPQAHRRRVPLRRQGLLHQIRQLHLPAGHRHSVRRGVRDLRHRHRVHPDRLCPARRHLPRRRDGLAMGPAPGGDRHLRRRRPVRLRARHVHRRQQRPAHAANARRRRHLLAQRQLVRAHGPVARVRPERPRPERHADRRLQPAQDGDQQQAVLERFAVGRRPRSRPASSATTCSTSMCATPCSSTRTKS